MAERFVGILTPDAARRLGYFPECAGGRVSYRRVTYADVTTPIAQEIMWRGRNLGGCVEISDQGIVEVGPVSNGLRRTPEACRERLALSTMVAEHVAQILLCSDMVTRVGLFGSVARRGNEHWCNDVDLMCFVTAREVREAQGPINPLAGNNRWMLSTLDLLHCEQEFQRIMAGFVTDQEIVQRSETDAAQHEVPVSLYLVPDPLDLAVVERLRPAWCTDSDFLASVSRHFRLYDPQVSGFTIAPPPWQHLPWREALRK